MESSDSEFEDRAYSCEDELSEIRRSLREYQRWLADPTRGPVIFRAEVIERLNLILD
jgi:hypothetical protein